MSDYEVFDRFAELPALREALIDYCEERRGKAASHGDLNRDRAEILADICNWQVVYLPDGLRPGFPQGKPNSAYASMERYAVQQIAKRQDKPLSEAEEKLAIEKVKNFWNVAHQILGRALPGYIQAERPRRRPFAGKGPSILDVENA